MQSSSPSKRRKAIEQNIQMIGDISSRVEIIQNQANYNRNKYADFLENINDFVINKIYEKEYSQFHDAKQIRSNYTYWMNGGFSRNFINNTFRVGHLDIHYAYEDKSKIAIQQKLENIYNDIILPLKAQIVDKTKIKTRIETTHFEVKNNVFKYVNNINVLFRPPFYSIKLVVDKQKGGKKQKGGNNFAYIDNLTIVEFHFEYYNERDYNGIITKMKQYFVIDTIPSIAKLENNTALNRLTETGAIAFSYLYPTNKNTQYGFDVDKQFIEAFLNNKYGTNNPNKNDLISDTYAMILQQYKEIYPAKSKAYNLFFIENIETLINSYTAPGYNKFIDFVNKLVISIFRPAINAFIQQINKELEANHRVKLFIAGGDAMRRYSYDIAFSKDIDTKLYIANLYANKNALQQQTKKKKIVEIITRHIVKLKFYLERNLQHMFVSNNLKHTYNGKSYTAHIIHQAKTGSHQLRTREIRKSDIFPVDLYSIDFRIKLIVEGKTYNHDISILDVVLQDNEGDNYDVNNFVNADVPYASLDFLMKDFLYTYYEDEKNDPNNPRAMARIASGKYIKDIIRAKCIMQHYMKEKTPDYIIPEGVCLEKNLNFTDIELNNIIQKLDGPSYKDFITIINENIRKKKQLSLDSVEKIRKVFSEINNLIDKPPEMERLLKYLNEFIHLETNIFYEDINSIDPSFVNYRPETNNYYQNYLNLFQYLCNPDVSSEKKNKLFYSDNLNNNLIKKINDNTSLEKLKFLSKSPSSIFLGKMNSSRSVIKKASTAKASTRKGLSFFQKAVQRKTTRPPLAAIPENKKRGRSSASVPSKTGKKARANTIRGGKSNAVKPTMTAKTVKAAKPMKQNIQKPVNNVKK